MPASVSAAPATPFDAPGARQAAPPLPPRAVGWWLIVCAAMVVAMMLIGAITRLTDSGLSIMEWAPLSGALPPLSQAEWQRLFDLYRTIPEYQQQNRGMGLAEFQSIFWWEWIHRFWGRLIGVVFALPFAWFLLRGRLDRRWTLRLGACLLLGGLQGAAGWFMVASGFADRVDVSQYRLTLHLGLAFLILGLLFKLALDILWPAPAAGFARASRLAGQSIALLALLSVTILSGAFVAGTDAGLIYNEFPLMGGGLVPGDYAAPGLPLWLNAFESHAAIQFHHRWLAVLTALLALGFAGALLRAAPARGLRRAALGLAALALLQPSLGILTLLFAVPTALATAHQAGAAGLFCALILVVHGLGSAPHHR